jgi:hypothetical protein
MIQHNQPARIFNLCYANIITEELVLSQASKNLLHGTIVVTTFLAVCIQKLPVPDSPNNLRHFNTYCTNNHSSSKSFMTVGIAGNLKHLGKRNEDTGNHLYIIAI